MEHIALTHRALTVLALLTAPVLSLAATPKAALVEQVSPSRPVHFTSFGQSAAIGFGPGRAGTLSVTAITLSNVGTSPLQVPISAVSYADGICGSSQPVVAQFVSIVLVPAGQTVHLNYPSPLVFEPNSSLSGQSCIGLFNPSNLLVTVVGFVN